MKFKKKLIPIDQFIDKSLYDKTFGYYMKKNPFGVKGDFITSSNVSVLFSEMIAIWIVSFWENLKCPKKFNLVELGGGNGEMMKILNQSFEKFPKFKSACIVNILEKSNYLKKIQKKKINNYKINWLKNLDDLKNIPTIFIANEFFDALPIKQFIKKKNIWYERYINISDLNKSHFKDISFDMNKFEKKIQFNISKNQDFIEYSPLTLTYIKKIIKKIELYNGGILIIDYGYNSKKTKNTLKAISNHKFSDILKNIGSSDISYNINFTFLKALIKKISNLNIKITNQRKFLLKMGILKRGEIISKNLNFSKKADIFFRIKRLIDPNQMGDLFKVMLIKRSNNDSQIGF